MSKKITLDYDYEDDNLYSNSYEDISSSYTDISSTSITEPKRERPKKRRRKRKHVFLKTIAILLVTTIVLSAACAVSFYIYAYNLINSIKRTPLDESDLGITTNTYSEVINIALLGLDTREDDMSGRSDANVVVTIDKENKKIKLTSIARDTYVAMDGRGHDKLTHAFAFGKSQLAVKTLNQNFGLEIKDYVTMNFFELARVIDYMGGITLDVDEKEFGELNGYIFPTTDFGDISCEYLKAPGVQVLSGAQAVCYARIRHTDGDVERGNRQKEVLTAMFAKMKEMSIFDLPKLAKMILSECETSLETKTIMSLGIWTVLNSPEFEQLSIPNDNIPSGGKYIGGVWYYVYDIETAKKEINDFIFSKNFYSPEQVAKRAAEAKENS